jgi:hypothetical protein
MRENRYHTLLEEIRVPEELEERILSAASRQTEQATFRRKQPVWRAVACAVLAVVLVAGGVSLRPLRNEPEKVKYAEGAEILELGCKFGLTAYAADLLPAANGNLVLGSGTSGDEGETTELDPQRAQYTNYRFRIEGEHIETLTLDIDRCGLYRVRPGQSLISVLENPAEEPYDSEFVYGLWIPPQVGVEGQDPSVLDGAELTVTARFTNGTEQTNIYRLTTQQLLISENENGTELLVPALAGSDQTGVSGLYLESLNSVWFYWPVEGSNTVSLSNRYGYRWKPGGESKTFHAGIDIPAESGTAITAAAGGTVTEAGYDPVRGNYLVLDHGNGMETVYAQCLDLFVKAGDSVAAGEQIAAVGSTGLSTGPHLHFEVRQNGEAQNPVAYFERDIRDTLKMG